MAPKLYTSFAKYYDRLESQYRDYEQDSHWIDSVIREHGAENLVDISCGTGNHVSKLLKIDPKRKVTAMDSSEEMVSIASKKVGDDVELLCRADFLKLPFLKGTFDCAMCMYWSLAGLDEQNALRLFHEVRSILKDGGIFVFDVENSEGIKENLIDAPFIDGFFQDGTISVIRANFSRKIEKDLVDWHAYYLLEEGGVSRLVEDRMNLRFYSREQLEGLLLKSGFQTLNVLSGPFRQYEKHSPSLYFIARKEG